MNETIICKGIGEYWMTIALSVYLYQYAKFGRNRAPIFAKFGMIWKGKGDT